MSEDTQEADSGLSPAYLREKLKDDANDLEALRDSAFMGRESPALQLLLSAKRGLGGDYMKNERVKDILEKETTETVNKAVNEEKDSLMTHANGLMQEDSSISQFHRIKQIQKIISVKGRIFQFSGNPDSGKTNFGLFCLELWQEETGGTVITNMESVKVGKTAKTFEELKEYAEKFKRWVFLMEDASNHISGYSVDTKVVEDKIRPFKNELAKLGGNLFLLGHTGKDIHPDLRRNSYRVHKPNKKTANLYKTDDKGRKADKIATYSGIPKSGISYNPTETTEFEIKTGDDGNDDEDIEMMIRRDIYKKLGNKNEVRTVDLSYNNSEVAQVMRVVAESEDFLKFDSSSPKSIKKKR